ncbi:MAG TPA: hypothetical protein VK013_04090 [Myxococcaceae bacterium]|nr:hypothetical protein [Myxococcaceae bacterium]
MSERVDKKWMEKGLGAYSTEAILGTLSHYGVQVDEAGFKALADAEAPSPVAMAQRWSQGWNATGPFGRFPLPAAEALWERWLPERPTPFQLARELAELLNALGRHAREGGPIEAVGEALGRVEALATRAPGKDGVEEAFVDEAFGRLPREAGWAFDGATMDLVRREQLDLASRWAALEERLYPDRKGLASAPVDARRGDRAEVLGRLVAAGGSDQSDMRRMLALDTLAQMEAWNEVRMIGMPLLDKAEAADDFHLALAICERLGSALQELGDQEGLKALEVRRAKIDADHARAHPGHHHHHH